MADEEVANIRLFGDWDLKIRFTYNVPDLPLDKIPKMLKEGMKPRAKGPQDEAGLSEI